jgi:biopolymer transport protein ExbB
MSFLEQTWKLWVDGGWTMIPLAIVAFMIYGAAVWLVMYFSTRGLEKLSDEECRRMIVRPDDAPELLRELLSYVQDGVRSLEQIQDRFAEVIASKLPEADRRMQLINVLIASAPLLGLLGTVLGMLTTFKAIAMGGGKTVDMIAGGISEALITTEVGLLVALPGMMLAFYARRRRNEYLAFLSRIQKLTLDYYKPIIHGSTRIYTRDDLKKLGKTPVQMPQPGAESTAKAKP